MLVCSQNKMNQTHTKSKDEISSYHHFHKIASVYIIKSGVLTTYMENGRLCQVQRTRIIGYVVIQKFYRSCLYTETSSLLNWHQIEFSRIQEGLALEHLWQHNDSNLMGHLIPSHSSVWSSPPGYIIQPQIASKTYWRLLHSLGKMDKWRGEV